MYVPRECVNSLEYYRAETQGVAWPASTLDSLGKDHQDRTCDDDRESASMQRNELTL